MMQERRTQEKQRIYKREHTRFATIAKLFFACLIMNE